MGPIRAGRRPAHPTPAPLPFLPCALALRIPGSGGRGVRRRRGPFQRGISQRGRERRAEKGKEIPFPEGAEAAVSFADVTVQFSPEEWALLLESQRELYRDVTMENYASLAFLGLVSAKPALVSKLERRQELYEEDRQRDAPSLTRGVRKGAGPSSKSPSAASGVIRRSTRGRSPDPSHRSLKEKDAQKASPHLPRNNPAQEENQKAMPKGRYTCNVCGKDFCSRGNLCAHKKIHMGVRPFECQECGKKFRRRRDLMTHKRTHTGEKPFQCKDCGKRFSQTANLYTHAIVHSGEKPFRCSECGKMFTHKFSFTMHQKLHAGDKPYQCDTCGKSFVCKKTLRNHQKCHLDPQPCVHCGKTFRSKVGLKEHLRAHTGEKPFVCDKCGKGHTSSNLLKYHLNRFHEKEPLHRCSQCNKSFWQKSSLKAHQTIHSGERPHKCAECGSSFRRKNTLKKHARTHTGEKPFACAECGKCFATNCSLRDHQMIHTGEKPFKCSYCEKSFRNNRMCQDHERVHTRHRPKCKKCGKQQRTVRMLMIHIRVHTGVKPFECPRCEKRYHRKTNLVKHMKTPCNE
ncbi:gastrula zinc finger protein XlCGF26.1-like isoform X1 [Rhineura floridana]|uniref:gastrula zinc finger protein XlCGF26.1-like isoform X1 n=2 Tax=Rhineura floridana TaxID=261503 RepID=UPI002AC82B31|nr:gastrula zinc finger protein XlCGF26.1-like isoform X1 [Rhineura floridana]